MEHIAKCEVMFKQWLRGGEKRPLLFSSVHFLRSKETSSSTPRCNSSIIVSFNVMIVTEGEEGLFFFFCSKLDNHSRAFSAVVVHGRYLFSRITLLVFFSSEGSSRFLWTSSIYIISSHAWEAMWKRYLLATLCPVIFIFKWVPSSAPMVWWVHSAQALRCDWERWGKVTVAISHSRCLQTKEELVDEKTNKKINTQIPGISFSLEITAAMTQWRSSMVSEQFTKLSNRAQRVVIINQLFSYKY